MICVWLEAAGAPPSGHQAISQATNEWYLSSRNQHVYLHTTSMRLRCLHADQTVIQKYLKVKCLPVQQSDG